MILDSLRMFIDRFCAPERATEDSGMEFKILPDLIPCFGNDFTGYLIIDSDFSRITVAITEKKTEITSEETLEIQKASFQVIIESIERLRECCLH